MLVWPLNRLGYLKKHDLSEGAYLDRFARDELKKEQARQTRVRRAEVDSLNKNLFQY